MTTSTYDPFYFIEFQDGRTVFRCPESWRPTLNALTRSAAKTSSGGTSSGATSSGESFVGAASPPSQSKEQPAGGSIVTLSDVEETDLDEEAEEGGEDGVDAPGQERGRSLEDAQAEGRVKKGKGMGR